MTQFLNFNQGYLFAKASTEYRRVMGLSTTPSAVSSVISSIVEAFDVGLITLNEWRSASDAYFMALLFDTSPEGKKARLALPSRYKADFEPLTDKDSFSFVVALRFLQETETEEGQKSILWKDGAMVRPVEPKFFWSDGVQIGKAYLKGANHVS